MLAATSSARASAAITSREAPLTLAVRGGRASHRGSEPAPGNCETFARAAAAWAMRSTCGSPTLHSRGTASPLQHSRV